jgi:hypothetical protein
MAVVPDYPFARDPPALVVSQPRGPRSRESNLALPQLRAYGAANTAQVRTHSLMGA